MRARGRPLGGRWSCSSVTAVPSPLALPATGVPHAVAVALREGLRLRVDGSVGPTLELTGPPAAPLPDGPPGGYARILTAGWLAAAPDLDAAVAALVARLAPDGRIDCVEPTLATGALRRAQRLSAPAVHAATGWHVDRDVPAALRRGGLVITDLERFAMPTRVPVLRPFTRARGHHRVQEAS